MGWIRFHLEDKGEDEMCQYALVLTGGVAKEGSEGESPLKYESFFKSQYWKSIIYTP